MSNRHMHFILEQKVANSPEFLLFMSQSHLKIEFDSAQNEINVEIPIESPAEIEKLIKSISDYFEILTFSSGNSNNLSQESKDQAISSSNLENRMYIDFSFLKNECSETALTKLRKTMQWALCTNRATENKIANSFIWPLIKELSLYYSENESIQCEIGDVVSLFNSSIIIDDINYSHGIVFNISDDSVYLIPLLLYSGYSHYFTKKEIIFSNSDLYNKSFTVQYEASRYFSKKRLESVIGKVTPDYFNILLENLRKSFSFFNTTTKNTPSFIGIHETTLFQLFDTAFANLSKSNDFETFFKDLNITDENLKKVCIIGSSFDTINWDEIIAKCPDLSKKELKNSFKEWVEKHADLKEKCPTLSLTSLLKAIKKSINK